MVSLRLLLLAFFSLFLFGCKDKIQIEDIQGEVLQDGSVILDLHPNMPSEGNFEYAIKASPDYGEVRFSDDPRFVVYTPVRNYFGEDSFSFSVKLGDKEETAVATLDVQEVYIASRPMSVMLNHLISLRPGELTIGWFNSFDKETDRSQLRYHVHLSQDQNFYPSSETLVQTVQGRLSMTIGGLVEGETYYVAIIAEDNQGGWSKFVDKKSIELVVSEVAYQSNLDVVNYREAPISSHELFESTLLVTYSEEGNQNRLQPGQILVFSSGDTPAVRVLELIATEGVTSEYAVEAVLPKDYLQNIKLSSYVGSPDPLLVAYQYALNSQRDSLGTAEVALTGAVTPALNLPSEDVLDRLANEIGYSSWDEFVEQLFSQDVLVNSGSTYTCPRDLNIDFVPSVQGGTPYDGTGFGVDVGVGCSAGYSFRLDWEDVPTTMPNLVRVTIGATLTFDVAFVGRIAKNYDLNIVSLNRATLPGTTFWVPLGAARIPLATMLDINGKLAVEAKADMTSRFGYKTQTRFDYGVQYTPQTGFKVVDKDGGSASAAGFDDSGLYAPQVNELSGLLPEADFGLEAKLLFGPKLTVGMFNTANLYRTGFDGLVVADFFPSAGVKVELGVGERNDDVVEHLGATRFGIDDFFAGIGFNFEASLHIPFVDFEWGKDGDAFVPFRRLPEFIVEYADKELQSNEFEVKGVSEDYDADEAIRNIDHETFWHVVESENGSILPQQDRMIGDGAWNQGGIDDAKIILQYQPEIFSDALRESAVYRASTHYEVLEPKFLLEGRWRAVSTNFEAMNILGFAGCQVPGFPVFDGFIEFRFDDGLGAYTYEWVGGVKNELGVKFSGLSAISSYRTESSGNFQICNTVTEKLTELSYTDCTSVSQNVYENKNLLFKPDLPADILACMHTETPPTQTQLVTSPEVFINDAELRMSSQDVASALMGKILSTPNLAVASSIFNYDVGVELLNADEFVLTSSLTSRGSGIANVLESGVQIRYQRVERFER